MNSDDNGKVVGSVVMLIFVIIFSIWFYSADASGTGTVASKWVESSTSCDDNGNCTTSHSYMVQFKDSRVYKCFWGTLHWDPMMENSTISFNAKGRFISFFGWRIAVPDIFSWELLEAAH